MDSFLKKTGYNLDDPIVIEFLTCEILNDIRDFGEWSGIFKYTCIQDYKIIIHSRNLKFRLVVIKIKNWFTVTLRQDLNNIDECLAVIKNLCMNGIV